MTGPLAGLLLLLLDCSTVLLMEEQYFSNSEGMHRDRAPYVLWVRKPDRVTCHMSCRTTFHMVAPNRTWSWTCQRPAAVVGVRMQ